MLGTAQGVTYSGGAGEGAAGAAADDTTVCRIFSMTKAIGSLAAMILVDRGRLALDAPVGDVLPEWESLMVLTGWDGDAPVLRPPTRRATIRHLATHTSGLEYEFWNSDMSRFLKETGRPSILSGQLAGLDYPLMSEPGEKWGYGPSIDWLGRVVEAVDGRPIDAFCQDEIFGPLGMRDTAFAPDALADRLAQVFKRDEAGALQPIEWAPPAQPQFYGMGHALYSTAADYMKVLRMILNKGQLDGQRVLSEASARNMTENHMQGFAPNCVYDGAPDLTKDAMIFPDSTHGFGFVRHESDLPGKRRAGSVSWAGICNTHYWIDPVSDMAGIVMSQLLPFVDQRFMGVYDAFERMSYADQRQ